MKNTLKIQTFFNNKPCENQINNRLLATFVIFLYVCKRNVELNNNPDDE